LLIKVTLLLTNVKHKAKNKLFSRYLLQKCSINVTLAAKKLFFELNGKAEMLGMFALLGAYYFTG
tara:strand:- start:463 stop:657 length:195 start_codon:yes stop_codon:yes gene_type:complete